ncbi:TlpA family protein disulfide reductase [Salinispira pacifica]|uniref:ResA-like thiol:disulfide oxidoreductase n=1 Tax=Salinispira pacifica TaxID=1307761 RepID=V5WFF1_9SPIO|nr:TlpA disulfide reductase family protein [Salinispira pacifica]AHC14522.1 ResA-like thiol:disulfide oxidoreductase [Salinispira pacifica]
MSKTAVHGRFRLMTALMIFTAFLFIPLQLSAMGGSESAAPAGQSPDTAQPEEQVQNSSEGESAAPVPSSIQTREQALAALRNIGMTVFDEAVEAPDFTLNYLNGDEVSLSDFRGKVVFLNFWATWCGPCRVEMPSMNDLYADLKNEDFVLLAVNQQEEPSVVSDFVDKEGYDFPILMDRNGRTSYQYGVRGIPTTYIIGPDGNVIAGKVGTHIYDGEQYRSLFRQLMQG